MRKLKFENGAYYHVYNRGVDKRVIYVDSTDYVRFIHALYICNDVEVLIKNISRDFNVQGLALNIKKNEKRSGNRLVDIACFSLMPNHYHLMLRQLVDNGISIFMQRLGTAHTMFFNKKYERLGCLFQGTFKAKVITSEAYLLHLTRYIHLNPIELINQKWKDTGISNWKEANIFLESYKWSSYQDYIGIKNFPSIINKGLIFEYYKGSSEYKEFINEFTVGSLDRVGQIVNVQG